MQDSCRRLWASSPTSLVRYSFHPRAFTVPELLAVIAIVLILIALLLPNLNSSREVARRAICMSQMHQHMVAAKAYANEHKRLLPAMYEDETINGKKEKYHYGDRLVLMRYLPVRELFYCPSQDPNALAKMNGNSEVVPRVAPFFAGNDRLDYGVNHYGRGDGKTDLYYETLGKHYENDDAKYTGGTLRPDFVANQDVVCYSDADANASPWDIGGKSRGSKVWPIQWSFENHAYKRHLGGYNTVGLDTSSVWHHPQESNPWEKWYIKRGRKNPYRP